jgi:FSR family fosmidomycin resistance protein-like MFS transporter
MLYSTIDPIDIFDDMNTKTILSNISVYSITHALIDAACAATVFAAVTVGPNESQNLLHLVILYNVIAFSTQPMFGLLVDKFDLPVHSAVAGVLLIAVAILLVRAPFLATLIAGVGNALFHVGGGVVCLNLASGKATLPGIYVAPGALGLMLGTLIGKGGHFVAWPFILLLVSSALLIVRLPKPKAAVHRKLPINLQWFEAVILLLLLSIAIRGIVGLSLDLDWKSNPALLIALTSAIVLGKALGGILGDKYGWTKVALAGLLISAPLLAFFTQVPAIAILGAFCFNLTMPITLTCLAEILPGKSGFAFGLTTLALIIGAGPTFTHMRALTSSQLFIFASIVISIIALYAGMKLYTHHFRAHKPIQRS